MGSPSGWLRATRSLPLLLGVVLALPAATLIVLGVRLLAQDRALAVQRRGEIAQSAADRAVRALEQEITAVTRRLGDAAWEFDAPAHGSIHVLIAGTGVRVEPATAAAWHPNPRRLPEPRAAAFVEPEAAEFQTAELDKALALNRRLAAQPDPATRAGGLLRQARVLRKMGRIPEAEAALRQLIAVSGVALDGVPADLVARQALCAIAKTHGRPNDLREAALPLQTDLNAGRWTIDRATYEFVAGRLGEWLGPQAKRAVERETLATAVEWLARADAERPAAGSRSVATGGLSAVVIWVTAPNRVAAMVALPEFVARAWWPAAVRASSPANLRLVAAADTRAKAAAPAEGAAEALRAAADTGLPWTIAATVPADADLEGLAARERSLLAGLAAVLFLAAAGGFLVVRARRQEIALARLQSDFVSAVSHEFRTPLTALGQFNELLEDGDDLPADKRRAYHQAQARATQRLHRLVESLLDFGRMEAGRRPYAFQPVDAGALVRDLVDEFRAELDGRGFEVRCDVEPGDHTIDADVEALGRAVWNLLDNAVKYSGESRALQVNVGAASPVVAPSGPAVAIDVCDVGIGIPRAEQARIFQKFVRGEGAITAHIKGTGIGLAMAQHIVSAHRGRILVDSEPGRGSTFTITLPGRRDSGFGVRDSR